MIVLATRGFRFRRDYRWHLQPAIPTNDLGEVAQMLGIGLKSLRMVHAPEMVERLPYPLRERARRVVTENARVLTALGADATEFGVLMSQSHASLRDDYYAVSVPAIDARATALQQARGVFGARLTGAGFGGCCVTLVPMGTAVEIGNRIIS